MRIRQNDEYDGLNLFPRFDVNFLRFPKKSKYKIALVPIQIDPTNFVQVKKDNYTLLQINENISDAIKNGIIDSSRQAAQMNAKLIIFSELSYPFEKDGYLNEILKKLSFHYGCYIIAGSYHELIGKDAGSNKSLIFNPQMKLLNQLKTRGGLIKGEDEGIKSHPDGRMSIFQTEFGAFLIAIGGDIANRNLIHNIKILNRIDSIYSHIDLIINPSYSDSEMSKELCKDASMMSQSYVINVNGGSENMQPSVFLFGDEIKPRNIKVESDNEIFFYDIDLIKLNKLRISYLKLRKKLNE